VEEVRLTPLARRVLVVPAGDPSLAPICDGYFDGTSRLRAVEALARYRSPETGRTASR